MKGQQTISIKLAILIAKNSWLAHLWGDFVSSIVQWGDLCPYPIDGDTCKIHNRYVITATLPETIGRAFPKGT